MMEKYFNLQYWLTIIGISLMVLFILITIIGFIVSEIITNYRLKSDKWEYNYVCKRWERKDKK